MRWQPLWELWWQRLCSPPGSAAVKIKTSLSWVPKFHVLAENLMIQNRNSGQKVNIDPKMDVRTCNRPWNKVQQVLSIIHIQLSISKPSDEVRSWINDFDIVQVIFLSAHLELAEVQVLGPINHSLCPNRHIISPPPSFSSLLRSTCMFFLG